MSYILVLEDDEDLREVIVETLVDAGFMVSGASGPDQAIEMARARRFQLFITDVRMAGSTDGVGALAAIKAIRRTIRSIIITGYASADVPVRAMRARADDYLLKGEQGFGVAQLLRVVRRVLEREEERPGLSQRLRQLVGLPARAWLESRLPALEEQRDEFYDKLFLGIRAGALSTEQIYQLWLRLEPVEHDYHSLSKPAQVDALGQMFQALCCHLTEDLDLPGWQTQEPPTRQEVANIYNMVRNGQISPDALRLVPIVRSDPQARKQSAEAFTLYQLLYGGGEAPAVLVGGPDPRLGLIVDGHRIREVLPPVGEVQRYKASAGESLRLLEVLPVTPQSTHGLAWEKRLGSLLYGEKRGEEYFVLREWSDREQTLVDWIVPGGAEEGEVVNRLRPLFEWVYRAHQQGLADGGLSARRVQLTSRGPLVSQFASHHQWRIFLESGHAQGGFSMVYVAPEVFRTSPTPAADQYSLGVMVYQLVAGARTSQLSTLLSGFEEVARLTTALRRMLDPEPTARFPNVGYAWQALQQSVSIR